MYGISFGFISSRTSLDRDRFLSFAIQKHERRNDKMVEESSAGFKVKCIRYHLKNFVLKVEIDFRELIRKTSGRVCMKTFGISCFMERF